MPEASEKTNQVDQPIRANLGVRILNLLGMLSILGSVASWFASMHWIADILTHLRVQYALFSMPLLVLCVMSRKKISSIVICSFIAYNVWPTLPYFISGQQASTVNLMKGSTLRILSFNVLRTNEEFKTTLDEIMAQDADFIFLMEVQNEWKSYLEEVKERYPFQKVMSDPAYTGVAFLSKNPWKSLDVVVLGEVSNPSIDVRIPLGDDEASIARVIATHPLPPFGEMLTRSRDQQLKTLAERFAKDECNLMVGDFNLTPWSPRFASIFKPSGLRDASIGYGIDTTLDPLPTWLGGVKVDYVLHNSKVKVSNYRAIPSAHSDHKMIVVDFAIEK